MATEYIVAICFACFALGVGFGMAVPFIFCALFNKMSAISSHIEDCI